MKMSTIASRAGFLAGVAGMLIVVSLSGCPAADKSVEPQDQTGQKASPGATSQTGLKPEEQPRGSASSAARPPLPARDLTSEMEQVAEKPRDLGPPLVDHPDALVRLNPQQPVWIDRQNKHVVLQGEVCRAGYPLEFFATYSNRAYESVLSVNVTPSIVHAGLLAVGAVPGHPAQFQPNFVPPSGTEVAIEVRWKDPQGKLQSAPAQHWIRHIKTKKELDTNWVFGGSMFVTDETTGKKYYQADSGELICVLSLPTAMLDLPIRGYGALEARSFEAFEEHLPPPGTPTTILLKPILSGRADAANGDAKSAAKEPAANDKRAEAETKAVAAVEPWLALVDQGQYARGWETAAEFLKAAVDRRDFVKSLNEARKPLGEVESRQLLSKQYATQLPGAPDGQYVVVQYKTSFAKKKSATETVTPMLDQDKKWRVSGYYVK